MSIIPRVIKMHRVISTGGKGRMNNRSMAKIMKRLIRIVMRSAVMTESPDKEESNRKIKVPIAINCPWARFMTLPVLNIRTNPMAERAYMEPSKRPLNKRFQRSVIML